jgi:hypothetical protein
MQNKIQETTFIKPITTVTLSIKKKVNVVSRGLRVPLEKKKCTKKYLNAYLNWDIKQIAPTNTVVSCVIWRYLYLETTKVKKFKKGQSAAWLIQSL